MSSKLDKYKKIFVEEFEGVTVDEAVKLAIDSLKMSKEELQIKILYEGEPGLFGLEGEKPARIKVTPNISKVENVIKFYFVKLLDFIRKDIIYVEVKIEEHTVSINTIVSSNVALKEVTSKEVYNSIVLLTKCFISQILPHYEVSISFTKSASAK